MLLGAMGNVKNEVSRYKIQGLVRTVDTWKMYDLVNDA